MQIFTIGHSTRGADEFRDLLEAYQVHLLADVRQFPGSRRYPQFGQRELAEHLAAAGIDYWHDARLGGRRRGQADSPNDYWQSASFRAYADHMATEDFNAALEELKRRATQHATAIMCAEAVPWRCHRWLISDALAAQGIEVMHILDQRHSQPHELNPHARRTKSGQLVYPKSDQLTLPQMNLPQRD